MSSGGAALSTGLIAAPMHGEVKLRAEGLRTRDGHLIEWFTRLRPEMPIAVHSRPEPWPRLTLARRGGVELPSRLELVSPQPLALPSPRDRRAWWVSSGRYRRPWPTGRAAVAWNPIEAAAAIDRGEVDGPLLFDLLDDWTRHGLFTGIREELEAAYATVFGAADVITANSEGTVELAGRFGREAELIPNGVDPERFALPRRTAGPVVVGYGGKIGSRLDLDLIERTAAALPEVEFQFAGPVMERESGRRLRHIANLRLLGDQRYDRYPEVLAGWDVAWAPHRVGEGEVGGDAIKLNEYRAAGLPTFSTRIIGWQRFVDGVRAPADGLTEQLAGFIADAAPGRPEREPMSIPDEVTWRHKAGRILRLLEGGG